MFVLHRKLIKKATNSLILKLICESVAIKILKQVQNDKNLSYQIDDFSWNDNDIFWSSSSQLGNRSFVGHDYFLNLFFR